MKKLFVDMDGVVADFVDGVCRAFNKDCPYTNHLERRGPEWWGIEELIGVEKNLFWDSLDEKFWRDLKVTKEGNDIIDMAGSFVDYGNICFLTSPCRTRGCYEGKLRWAEHNFPGIPVMFASSVRDTNSGITIAPPKHMLASPDSMLIDDHVPNVESFSLHGGHTFLFPRYWNSSWALHNSWCVDLHNSIRSFTGR